MSEKRLIEVDLPNGKKRQVPREAIMQREKTMRARADYLKKRLEETENE